MARREPTRPKPDSAGPQRTRPDPRGHVLVTRAEPGAAATAERLAAGGWSPVLCPVLGIEARPFDRALLANAQGLLITSANAARRLADPAIPAAARALPIAAVGAATARAARDAGADNVASAEGDADALAALARTQFTPDAGALVFMRGADIAGDLAGALRAEGFAVREAVVYAARAASAVPRAAAAALAAGAAGAALFHSARAAAVFSELVRAAGLAPACATLTAVAISARAAAALDLTLADIRVAATPTEAALLAALADARA